MADATRACPSPATGTEAARPDDDAALVAAARLDRRAFAPLYRRYVDPVYRYCFRRLGGREAAEDATAAVFAKALAALPAYRDGSFRAWLFAIAHNAVVDALRARRPTAPVDAAWAVADPAPTPEEAALAADAGRSLRAVLERLSPDQRQVVELHLAGLSGPEIASVLGRSHAAVRAVQARAIARLRELLAAEHPNPPEEGRRHGR
jgi:RNA polymerase sigma-70 factor (ECF subfamily)